MPSATRQEAEKCAASMKAGLFGIDDITIAISVIELALDLWKMCQPAASANLAASSILSGNDYRGQSRAQRGAKRALRRYGQPTDDATVAALTDHILNHVANASTETAVACCAEPYDPSLVDESPDDESPLLEEEADA